MDVLHLLNPSTPGPAISIVNLGTLHGPSLARGAGWLILVAVLLLLGSVSYGLFRSRRNSMGEIVEIDASRQHDEHVATRVDDLLMLAALHDARKLTDAEYALEKTRVIRSVAANPREHAAYAASGIGVRE